MDIYLTILDTGERLHLPQVPEKVSVKAGTRFQSYDIMTLGEIKLPLGENLTEVSWSSVFPGSARKNIPIVSEWKDPNECDSWFHSVKSKGQKLRLMITGTKINWDLYLSDYTPEFSGGFGDISYSVSFTQAKDLIIGTDGSSGGTATIAKMAAPRPTVSASTASSAKTYTVKSGDSLWSIAQKALGDGSKYMQIYNLNTSKIKNPSVIQPGWVLKLP